jgi:DNA-binding LytR/AlgR family response regulator
VGDSEHLTRETMNTFEEWLRTYDFVRIHRSVMINRNRIRELRPLPLFDPELLS